MAKKKITKKTGASIPTITIKKLSSQSEPKQKAPSKSGSNNIKDILHHITIPVLVVAIIIVFLLALATSGFFEQKPQNNNTQNDSNKDEDSSITVIPVPINGVCGPAAKAYNPTEVFPQGELCTIGTSDTLRPSIPTLANGSEWTCSAKNGGQEVLCKATRRSKTVYPSDVN